MDIYDLKVAISNRADMNELVDKTCEMLGKDNEYIRDKFKMKTQADLKKTLDMCKFLKLKAIFDPTEKVNYLTVQIPEDKVVVKEEVESEENEEGPTEETEEPNNIDNEDTDDDPF